MKLKQCWLCSRPQQEQEIINNRLIDVLPKSTCQSSSCRIPQIPMQFERRIWDF